MACRREGISPCVLAQPGRPASSGSVTLHDQAGIPRTKLVMPHAADHAALENGDAIGARRAVREGAPPGDACRAARDRRLHHFQRPIGLVR